MLRSVLFWGSVPLVGLQALRVRRRAPRFAGAGGPAEGAEGAGSARRLVAIGDSIIAGVGAAALSEALVGQTARALAETLPARVEWIARGRIGANAGQALRELLPELPAAPADFFLVSVGVNDVTSLSTRAAWRRNLDALLAALRAHSPEAIIAMVGVPPMRRFPLLPQPLRALLGLRAEQFDGIARRVIENHPRALYLPLDIDPSPDQFAADGYHPSQESYGALGRAMAARIAAACTPPDRS